MKSKITINLINGSIEKFTDLDPSQVTITPHTVAISKVTNKGSLVRTFPMTSILHMDIKEES